jgi:hypothetical protein
MMLGKEHACPTSFDLMEGGTGKNAAKAILQDVYERIPFLEMKKTGYDWSVRAP